MGRGITKRLLDGLKDTAAGLPDKRGASNGRKYGIADFVLGAFAVFYFQLPSMLNFQESVEALGNTGDIYPAGRKKRCGTLSAAGETWWTI
jgi:hypothetical protein